MKTRTLNPTMEEDNNSREDNQPKEITMFYASSIKAKCPSCGEWLDEWFGDPRGSEESNCDFCGAAFTVHPGADIEFGY